MASAATATIRSAWVHDLDTITAIYADAVINTTTTYELEAPSRSSMKAKLSALREAGLPFLVAETEQSSSVVGFAYISPFRSRPAYRFTVEHSVYVDKTARRQGVGRLLLEAAIRECERLGFRQIVAVIGDAERNTASIAFHEEMGFRPSGRLEGSGYKFGRWLDTVFMQLSLNGGNSSPPDPGSLPEREFHKGEERETEGEIETREETT